MEVWGAKLHSVVRVEPTEKVTFERRSREEEAVHHVDTPEKDRPGDMERW